MSIEYSYIHDLCHSSAFYSNVNLIQINDRSMKFYHVILFVGTLTQHTRFNFQDFRKYYSAFTYFYK
jgi:hypothetical protein